MLIIRARTSGGVVPLDVKTFTFPGGLLRVECVDGDFVLFDQQTEDQEARGVLREVWRDGKLLIDESLATIRARLRNSE